VNADVLVHPPRPIATTNTAAQPWAARKVVPDLPARHAFSIDDYIIAIGDQSPLVVCHCDAPRTRHRQHWVDRDATEYQPSQPMNFRHKRCRPSRCDGGRAAA